MLYVHRAERADALADALRELVADPLPDPFAREVVSVPTRGMERWLTQRMSTGLGASPGRSDGVCANVDFPTPRRLVGDAVAAAAGIDPATDPWLPERAVWPLLELVEGFEGAQRFAAARHLADLFDRYALHRPDMVRAWAAGESGDEDSRWQAELWRKLRARIGVPGPAERVEQACARLEQEPGRADLPPRFSLFGLTRLPAGRLDVLKALATHRDVHLFVLHPSPALWARIPDHATPSSRRDDRTASLPQNPLLASWGRDSRELQLIVGSESQRHGIEPPRDSLLAHIQEGVRADRVPTNHAADRSIQIHSCHGRARQVEVLRDAILHELQRDPTLEPRDVIVMCPDIEAFAPLIQATFGATEDETHDLRVRLADRSLRQTNPILGVTARLIELAEERLTASQVLDLADREPVRRRFGFDDEDLGRLEEWVKASGIRWGLDAPHRKPFRLDTLPSGTWRAGLDRLLLGVTMTEDERRLFARTLPLDDVESGAIDLVGRFAEFVGRLEAVLDRLARPQPIQAWAAAIADGAEALTSTPDAWQRAELQRLLDDVVGEAAGSTTELATAEVRALLADRLKGRPTRANFRTGHMTVCTLVPMRSVPHRVVCLLGLDDGVFPRKSPQDGDDLMLRDPRIGERDARTEDRQLLLDALMAAQDRLILTYTGNDERTNLSKPPAVPVGELLDVIERVTGERLVTRHPLQPFDQRNFTPGALAPGTVWSFDDVTLHGARAMADERHQPRPFLERRLPPRETDLVELADLVRFVERPVRAFLRQRLGISLGDFSDEVEDALPVELDGLARWSVGQRLLEARLDGVDSRTAILAEIARGELPPGVLGKPVIDELVPVVDGIVDHVPKGETGSVDVKLGTTLRGTVPGVRGDTLRTVTYSRVNPRHRLAAWVRLLALTVSHPQRTFDAVTIGRGEDSAVTIARIPPLDAATARDHLDMILDLYERGMREPPPLASATSAAYAAAARSGGDPVKAGRNRWEARFGGEDVEPEHQLVHGGVITFDELLAAPAGADERGAWWDPDETRRFGLWSRRLWDGLLGHERLEHR
jgi:exodeoxyribonuclease V gamma subunit